MNAEEVRALMPKTAEVIVEEITQRCADRAREGYYDFRTYDYDFGSSTTSNSRQEKIVGELKKLGFTARHAVENKQFVDAYLYVSWKKEGEDNTCTMGN